MYRIPRKAKIDTTRKHLVNNESRNFTSRASETIKNKKTFVATTVYFQY